MESGPRRPLLGTWSRLLLAAVASLSLIAGGSGTAAAAPREGFAVEPFTNVKRASALHHLAYALPALVAERFAQVAPLRFAGSEDLFSRAPTTGIAWLVRGAFEPQSDGTVA